MLHLEDLIFEDGIAIWLDNKKRVIENHKSIFLFGSARGGEKVFDYCRAWGLQQKIVYVADNDLMKQGKDFHGVKIISADELKKIFPSYDDAVIIVASGSAHIIKKQLLSMGFPENRIDIFSISVFQTNPTPFQFFSKRKDDIHRVYDILEDERSKDVFIGLLNYKMTRNSKWLKDIADQEESQYFDAVMEMSNEESFVDCGAYIGDTFDAYRLQFGRWKQYYCFEADPEVFKELEHHIKTGKHENVFTFNIGCWDKVDELSFMKLGSGSSSISTGKETIRISANSLDNILADKEVSIIKMDIEGAEEKALLGAKNIIASQHPKLAISIYHSLEDFINIPIHMKEYGNGYKIYMRHYRELTDSETVCYAV